MLVSQGALLTFPKKKKRSWEEIVPLGLHQSKVKCKKMWLRNNISISILHMVQLLMFPLLQGKSMRYMYPEPATLGFAGLQPMLMRSQLALACKKVCKLYKIILLLGSQKSAWSTNLGLLWDEETSV